MNSYTCSEYLINTFAKKKKSFILSFLLLDYRQSEKWSQKFILMNKIFKKKTFFFLYNFMYITILITYINITNDFNPLRYPCWCLLVINDFRFQFFPPFKVNLMHTCLVLKKSLIFPHKTLGEGGNLVLPPSHSVIILVEFFLVCLFSKIHKHGKMCHVFNNHFMWWLLVGKEGGYYNKVKTSLLAKVHYLLRLRISDILHNF